MPWSTRKPGTAAKYRTKEHRTLRAHYVGIIRSGQPLECTAKVCAFDRAPITNPDGREPDGLHLGHQDNGIDYAGPQHNRCNVRDGAVRGNKRSRGLDDEPKRWELRRFF